MQMRERIRRENKDDKKKRERKRNQMKVGHEQERRK